MSSSSIFNLTLTLWQLSTHLLSLSCDFTSTIRPLLITLSIPRDLLSLPQHLQDPEHTPSPIIPLMTCHPRPLSAYLLALGMNARPITWPTVPKGKDRVRVCLHAGNSKDEVDRLVHGVISWAKEMVVERKRKGSQKLPVGVMLESKL